MRILVVTILCLMISGWPQARVIDIALELGYEDASHFARACRRMVGASPREYRRRHILH